MIEINNKTRCKIDIKLIKRIVGNFLKYYKLENEDISVAFVGDTTIRHLNNKYRGKDEITDILSFNEEGKKCSGEILIDYAQIRRQAKKFSPTEKDELIFILVHGLLHLLGHVDKTERGRQEMERKGKEFVEQLKS